MPKYKIHIDRSLPDKSQIVKHKNFDSLYNQYQVTTRFQFWRELYRKPTFFAGLVAVFAIFYLVFEANNQPLEPATFAYVHPPHENLDPNFEQIDLVPDQDYDIAINESLGLKIPANAFADSNGKVIEGPVQLHYRSFVDPVDFYLAGVPMEYDSAQQQYQLISGGALEIFATKDSQRLFMVEGLSLEIEYLHPEDRTDYSVYYLDHIARNWQYKGKDAIEAAETPMPQKPEMPALLAVRNSDTLLSRSVAAPFRPGKPFGVKLANPNAYPEFRQYAKTYWEYLEGHGSENPWQSGLISENGEQQWEDVRVHRLNQGRYRLTFGRQEADGSLEIRHVIARPLFEAKNQEAANRLYQERLNAYEAELTTWQNARDARRKRQQEIDAAQRSYDQSLREWEALMAEATEDLSADSTYIRRFKVAQLGIYQLGRKSTRPAMDQNLALDAATLEALTMSAVDSGMYPVMVFPGQNTLYRLSQQEDQWMLPANMSDKAMVWFRLAGKQFGLIQIDSLKNMEETIEQIQSEEAKKRYRILLQPETGTLNSIPVEADIPLE